jgi:FAD/FMN-containing dehydrogenase
MSLTSKLAGIVGQDNVVAGEDISSYWHDASIFELKPQMVVYPKDAVDICQIVKEVASRKKNEPELSVTARSGGTDMSGGAVNDSLLLDMTKHFTHIGPISSAVTVQPGVYYRDFEKQTLKSNKLLPSYPASREICTVGGMIANNSGGEKSLVYGKTAKYVRSVSIVLRDGKEHTLRPLSGEKLEKKLAEKSLEGDIFRQLHKLLSDNQQALVKSRPKVSKNSTGYNVWDAWDGTNLDPTKLVVGSQGTLGVITEAELALVDAQPASGMLVLFLPDLHNLGRVISSLLPLKPTSMESFDEHTLQFAFRFFLSFRHTLGLKKFILLGLSFIPLLKNLLRYLPGLPKLVVLVEFEGKDQPEVDKKVAAARHVTDSLDIESHVAADKKLEEKFWLIRRESFNLLRKNVRKNLHTAPFIDDVIVPPAAVEAFLPKLTDILEKYDLLYTIAGHVGDGNFHIIPLMDLAKPAERDKIPKVLREVTELVLGYGGSLSGEHNDGLIRGPFMAEMFDEKTMRVQNQVKQIFDPDNLFNPHKKTDADWQFSSQHIRKKFDG